MIHRLFAYSIIGILLEVIYTGLVSALRRDRRLTATTYLWMLPIYALGGAILDGTRWLLSGYGVGSLWIRSLVYVPAIYVVEYLSGWILLKTIGRCPWDYSDGPGHHLHGLIRLEHAPAWWLCGILFELLAGVRVGVMVIS